MTSAGPSPYQAAPEAWVADAVFAEQVATVFRQMPIALVVNLVNAALIAVTLGPAVGRSLPILWFGVVGAVTIGRGWLWWRYRRAATAANARWWSRGATVGSFCAGLAWGLGGAMLFALVAPLGQLFLTIATGGMCIGAVVLSASHLPTLLAFLLPACLPMATRVIAEGTPINEALGVMIGVFAAAMVLAARHLNRVFTEAMRLRFELDATNRHLHAEIAEHRATEAALQQAQKLEAIGHLTGGIAHDFNNLLTVVIGSLVMAQERLGPNSTAEPLIESATQAAQRGVALIQRLLGFARRQRLDPQAVDLGQLLSRMREMLLTTLGPRIALITEIAPTAPPAEIDPNQLELAILNLANNARDAMPEGGTLRITIANRRADATAPGELADGDYVVIGISDTGTGMDEATLAQAFDPFFTTKELGAGTGLGLATVQGFVAQSGGAVRLLSRVGAGTTVELWLAAGEAPPPRTAAALEPTRAEIGGGAAQIVVCDDDAGVRRYIADYLGTIGHTVHQAAGPEEALHLVDGIAADLLIADYSMPGMSGTELLNRARRQRPDLKALLITGHAGAVGEDAAIAILRKPFGPTELARRVHDILSGTDAGDAA